MPILASFFSIPKKFDILLYTRHTRDAEDWTIRNWTEKEIFYNSIPNFEIFQFYKLWKEYNFAGFLSLIKYYFRCYFNCFKNHKSGAEYNITLNVLV